MPDSTKPLFSRPVLAAIMIFSTLAIWLLNLTAPSSKLPTPIIETWTTSSGIPVTWLMQPQWKNANKLEVRILFNAPASNPQLTKATLALLMSDSLPLSSASINQRLTPLAAQVGSHYDNESQTIGLTLNNESQYLRPTLSLISEWLQQPKFKSRTFDNWLARQKNLSSAQNELNQRLFPRHEPPHKSKQSQAEQHSLSISKIQNYYQELKSHSSGIFLVGAMNKTMLNTVKAALNTISQDYRLSVPTHPHLDKAISQVTKIGQGQLWQTQSALALSPLNTIKDWISLQLWGADLVKTLNQQNHIDFVQLNLSLSQHRPWAWWNIQYGDDTKTEINPSQPKASIVQQANSFTQIEQIPSVKDKKAFDNLLDSFKEQIQQQALSPTWWSYITTQVTHKGSPVTLKDFANGYKEAIDSYTQDDYKAALSRLLKVSSYQEIQVYQ